jgi:short-subunit dehydrogenase
MNNKLILITGGSSGIGKATAKALHQQGARIILQARTLDKLKSAAAEIDPSGKNISYYSTDLTDEQAVALAANEIVAKEGIPDVVINSAGAGEWLSFSEASLAHFKETMDSPYIATALTCKVFYDKMQQRGTGHFIIINSVAAYFSFPGATGYTPTRWAMLGLAKSLQADLFKTNFTVSTIVLGKVDSPYFTNNPISEARIPRVATLLNPTLSEEAAGRIIAKNVRTKSAVVIKPTTMAFFVFLNRLFPGVFRWLMRL